MQEQRGRNGSFRAPKTEDGVTRMVNAVVKIGPVSEMSMGNAEIKLVEIIKESPGRSYRTAGLAAWTARASTTRIASMAQRNKKPCVPACENS